MSMPNLPDALGARLSALPRFEPDEALWARIEARRRRAPRRALLATAASLAAFALVLALVPRERAPEPARPDALARVRALEIELAEARPRGTAQPEVLALEHELAGIDAKLQSAYDRRAARHELDALWQARLERLAALLVAYRHADTLVRI